MLPQSALPDVQHLLLQPHRLWRVKSNRNLLGSQDHSPTAPHALLWAPLSKQVDYICDLSGSYFRDELVVLPSIWAWDAKLWSKHLKRPTGWVLQQRCKAWTRYVRIPRATKVVFIHIHIQISQDKNQASTYAIPKNICPIRCPQESLHVWLLGTVRTSNGCGHLSNIQHFTVLRTLPSPNLAFKTP